MAANESVAKVTYRRPLNDEQYGLLSLLYGYRFATASLLSQRLDKTNVKLIQKKLKILEDQGFIAKHYDKAYKLQGKPAEYYLLPKGGRSLKAKYPNSDILTEQGIKTLYRNKTASEDFRRHCIHIFRVRLRLRSLYEAKLHPFTMNQLHNYDDFPSWKPDLYLSMEVKDQGNKRYFLDYFDGIKPFFVNVRKMRSYLTFAEEANDPPIILVICETQRHETKLRRQIRKALDDSYEELTFATTTIEHFLGKKEDKVWRNIEDDEELIKLEHI